VRARFPRQKAQQQSSTHHDAGGPKNVLDANALRHLANQHGRNAATEQLPTAITTPEAVAIKPAGTDSEHSGPTVKVMSALLKKCTMNRSENIAAHGHRSSPAAPAK